MTEHKFNRLAALYLGAAGYIAALLMALIYWQTDLLLQQERRQSREQFHAIQAWRAEALHKDEAARQCEAKMALVPNSVR